MRAHQTCIPAMLQRTLSVSPALAEAVQSKLTANGVLGLQANAWGMYQATNSLFDRTFPTPDAVVSKTKAVAEKMFERVFEDDTQEPLEDEPIHVSAEMLYDEALWIEAQEIITRNNQI